MRRRGEGNGRDLSREKEKEGAIRHDSEKLSGDHYEVDEYRATQRGASARRFWSLNFHKGTTERTNGNRIDVKQ